MPSVSGIPTRVPPRLAEAVEPGHYIESVGALCSPIAGKVDKRRPPPRSLVLAGFGLAGTGQPDEVSAAAVPPHVGPAGKDYGASRTHKLREVPADQISAAVVLGKSRSGGQRSQYANRSGADNTGARRQEIASLRYVPTEPTRNDR